MWVYPSSNTNCCPVRLTEKYLSLCLVSTKKSNFYLQSLTKKTPKQWYGNQVVGLNTIGKVVKDIMEKANIEGFFTNHSLRCTGGMRLFQVGVDRKLVKEFTGHQSDAVDKYQITNDMQRENLSKILRNDQNINPLCGNDSAVEVKTKETCSKGENSNDKCLSECTCKCNSKNVTVSNIGDIIEKIVNCKKTEGKTVIKLQIEMS